MIFGAAVESPVLAATRAALQAQIVAAGQVLKNPASTAEQKAAAGASIAQTTTALTATYGTTPAAAATAADLPPAPPIAPAVQTASMFPTGKLPWIIGGSAAALVLGIYWFKSRR